MQREEYEVMRLIIFLFAKNRNLQKVKNVYSAGLSNDIRA